MNRTSLFLAAALTLPLVAVVTTGDAHATPSTDLPRFVGQEVVVVAPPAEVVETIGPAPSPRHFWVRGYHRWTGSAHVWVPGHWDLRRDGYRWADAHWERFGNGWRFHEGVWIKL